jgi:hypothetical protein
MAGCVVVALAMPTLYHNLSLRSTVFVTQRAITNAPERLNLHGLRVHRHNTPPSKQRHHKLKIPQTLSVGGHYRNLISRSLLVAARRRQSATAR